MFVRTMLYAAVISAAVVPLAGSTSLQAKQAVKKTPVAAAANADVKPIVRPAKPHAFTFPNPWPAPLEVPNAEAEEIAWYLGQKVLAGGPDALASLERAALLSGFSIHSSDGKVLYSPEKGCDLGLSMLDLDLAIAADLTSRQMPARLSDLQSFLTEKGFKSIPASQLLGKGVLSWLDNYHPGKYFFSNFVIGLSARNDGGEVDFENLTPETEICAAQLTFLSYVAFGMSAVGESTRNGLPPGVKEDIRRAPGDEDEQDAPGVPPAEEPPPTVEDPPPHGPYAEQSTPAGVSLRNLMQAMSQFASMDWTEYVRRNTPPGSNPQFAVLAFVRMQIYRTALQMSVVGQTPSPLVRTKTFGQKGGNANLRINATLFIPSDIRQMYAAAQQELPGQPSLLPDGPIDVSPQVTYANDLAGDDIAIDLPDWQYVGTGQINFLLVGATQKKHLNQDAEAVRRWPSLSFGFTPKSIPTCPKVPLLVNVPVTDWRNRGMWVDYQIDVTGNGTYAWPKGGGKVVWSVNRMICKSTLFDLEMPGGAVLVDKQPPLNKLMEYTAWQKDPSKPLEQSFEYFFRDNFIYSNRTNPGGCGVKDSRRKPWNRFRRYAHRFEKIPSQMGLDLLQVHEVSNTKDFSFMSGFWPVPVTITATGQPPKDDHAGVFHDLERSAPPPYAKVENGMIILKGRPKSGEFYLTGKLNELQGGSGKNTVKIRISWIVGGSHDNYMDKYPPKGDSPPPPPPPPTNPYFAVQTNAFRGGVRLSDLDRKSVKRTRTDELWVDHNSAATCSEIILSESPPPRSGKG